MATHIYNATTSVPQPFEFEKWVDTNNRISWMQNNWHHSIYWSALYVIVIFGTKRYMKDRPPFDLRHPLIAWNLGLTLFSMAGCIRMGAGFLHMLNEFGFTFTCCDNQYIRNIQPSVFWGWLFVVSKVVELGDTLFIVMRKRNLIFLHWYHHIMTLMMCWYTTGNLVAVTHWFGVMNYTVHSIMYFYYTLSAMEVKLPRKFAMFITSMQLLQMFLGSFVCYWAIRTKYRGEPCNFSDNAIVAGFVVYLSYLALFARLFYLSYIKKKAKAAKLQKKDQ